MKINLKDIYPEYYSKDFYVLVSDELFETIQEFERFEKSYSRKLRRYNATYSLNKSNLVENSVLHKSKSAEEIYDRKMAIIGLYKAILSLPENQKTRIIDFYFLGLSKAEIARKDNVSVRVVDIALQRGRNKLKIILTK